VTRWNPTTVFLASTVVVLAALFVPGPVGGVLLLLVAAVAATLLTATWHRLPLVGRAIRLVVLALLVIAALRRIF
jgi:hypothetical protein